MNGSSGNRKLTFTCVLASVLGQEIAYKLGDASLAVELLLPGETALSELRSVHAAHAGECLRRARDAVGETPPVEPSPWRQALMDAADGALRQAGD